MDQQKEILEALKSLANGSADFWKVLVQELSTRYNIYCTSYFILSGLFFVLSFYLFKRKNKGEEGEEGEIWVFAGATAAASLIFFLVGLQYLVSTYSANLSLLEAILLRLR